MRQAESAPRTKTPRTTILFGGGVIMRITRSEQRQRLLLSLNLDNHRVLLDSHDFGISNTISDINHFGIYDGGWILRFVKDAVHLVTAGSRGGNVWPCGCCRRCIGGDDWASSGSHGSGEIGWFRDRSLFCRRRLLIGAGLALIYGGLCFAGVGRKSFLSIHASNEEKRCKCQNEEEQDRKDY